MEQVVLVTGASSGIGKAVAELLVTKGLKVYGTSRTWSTEPVQKQNNYYEIGLDINDDKSTSYSVQKIIEKEKRLDIVINNAGFGYVSSVMFGSTEDAKKQFETNFFGTIRVIEAAMPQMIAQKGGKIITVGSIGGRIAIPYQGLYSASKSAIAIYSDALRMECKKYNIKVSVVEPGDTKTDFDQRRVVRDQNIPEPVNKEMIRAVGIMRKAEHNGRDAEKVAKVIYKVVKSKNPKSRYTSGIDAKLVAYGTKIFPKGMVDRLIGMNYKISGKKIV